MVASIARVRNVAPARPAATPPGRRPRDLPSVRRSGRATTAAPVSPSPGGVLLILHAHLPYVRHPEHDDHLEERWLFEAMLECYLPLVAALDGLSPHNPA